MHFKMLSAICFHMDQLKILLSGDGLSMVQKMEFILYRVENWLPAVSPFPTMF